MSKISEILLEDIIGADIFGSMLKILTLNPTDPNSKLYSVWEIATEIHTNIIVPIAACLMFIYFIIAIVDKLSGENFTWEQLWRQMAMLLASKFLIDNALIIMDTFYTMGLVFVNDIVAAQGLKDGAQFQDISNDLVEGFKDNFDSGILRALSEVLLVIFLFVPWLAAWVLRMAVIVICYTRLIELFIRTIFAPLALADFFHQGLQGAGWRYLKNYLAVCIQGAVLLCIGIVFSHLVVAITMDESNLFSYIGMVLAFTFSGVALMFKSLSLTRELLGTG